ncbi:hypothetical protein A1D25_02980 [Ursidibacter arcticus]|uniref:hypothetical protein n=1 Tax=Ursidibacter arcticus TaxID=1524965 RepID=UPI0012F8C564|nr:hypothetical protein [Ursidibacter arcticus]KAE9537048.1 hypothetical protein A1D25_02980 [Ursidibacter arcticus]
MKKLKIQKLGRPVIPSSKEFKQNSPIYIPLFFADPTKKRQIVWELQLEDGLRDTGNVQRNRVNLPSLPVGKHQLTLIVGQPMLVIGHNIYQCELTISE